MKDFLLGVYKIILVLVKLLPVLLEIIEDFGDDGRLNKSNTKENVQTPVDYTEPEF